MLSARPRASCGHASRRFCQALHSESLLSIAYLLSAAGQTVTRPQAAWSAEAENRPWSPTLSMDSHWQRAGMAPVPQGACSCCCLWPDGMLQRRKERMVPEAVKSWQAQAAVAATWRKMAMCHFLCAQQCAQEPISTSWDLIGTGTKQAGKENFSQLECGINATMAATHPSTFHSPLSFTETGWPESDGLGTISTSRVFIKTCRERVLEAEFLGCGWLNWGDLSFTVRAARTSLRTVYKKPWHLLSP